MNTDLTARDVFAYNSKGKRHRAPFEVINALEQEQNEAQLLLVELTNQAFDADGNWTSREAIEAMDTQEGYVTAISHVVHWLKNYIEEL